MKSTKRRRVDVNLDELDRVLDGARRSAAERGRLRQTQGRLACPGGDAGATAQYGEDQRRAGRTGEPGSRRRDSAGYQRFRRNPDTGATERRRLAARRRSTLRTRS